MPAGQCEFDYLIYHNNVDNKTKRAKPVGIKHLSSIPGARVRDARLKDVEAAAVGYCAAAAVERPATGE